MTSYPELSQILPSLRILVVDDHMLMRNLVIQNLKAYDVSTVDIATDGQKAWDKIREKNEVGLPYQLIFLDWHMPEIDGLEVLKKCRANEAMDKAAIIMLTAEQEKQNVLEAINAGATSYLVKPVSREDFSKGLHKVITWLTKHDSDYTDQPKKDLSVKKKPPELTDQLKEELSPVVTNGVKNVFSEMFDVQIISNTEVSQHEQQEMVTIGHLHNKDISLILRFVFEKELLAPLLKQLYSNNFLEDDSLYQDAACEIVNILCSQIKAFLNRQGYKLQMEFPQMDVQDDKLGGAQSIMNVKFSLNQNDYFMVDLSSSHPNA